MTRGFFAVTSAALAGGLTMAAQQVPDRAFRPTVENPADATFKGPLVCLDEAHANFHTLEPFGAQVTGGYA